MSLESKMEELKKQQIRESFRRYLGTIEWMIRAVEAGNGRSHWVRTARKEAVAFIEGIYFCDWDLYHELKACLEEAYPPGVVDAALETECAKLRAA